MTTGNAHGPDGHDYGVCPERQDGQHEPRITVMQDEELIAIGYVTLECAACGQTTGYPVVDFKGVDW